MEVSKQLNGRSKTSDPFIAVQHAVLNVQRQTTCWLERCVVRFWTGLTFEQPCICLPTSVLTMRRIRSSIHGKIIILSLHSKYSGLVSGSAHLQYADEHPWHPCGHPAWHGHTYAQSTKSISHWYSQRKSPKHCSLVTVFTELGKNFNYIPVWEGMSILSENSFIQSGL